MYIPSTNTMNDQNEILKFMKRFSFATIITVKENAPIATHLPFLVELRDNNITLTSHFAKANDHWKYIENQNILVIFSEPHAYISPKNYDKELNVPTWNYLSVHAYGKGELIVDYERTIKILENTIDNYESSYRTQWNDFPEDYKLRMTKGIVTFKITISDLQAKKKLSQNRTESEKLAIINSLSLSNDTNEKIIAEYMKNEPK